MKRLRLMAAFDVKETEIETVENEYGSIENAANHFIRFGGTEDRNMNIETTIIEVK